MSPRPVTTRASSLVLRTYGPLAAVALALLTVIAVVHPADRRHDTVAAGATTGPVTPGVVASGGGAPAATGPAAAGPADAAQPAPAATGPGAAAEPGGGVQPCPDRAAQVPGDPYSPPCFTFSGKTGGPRSRGVAAPDIPIGCASSRDRRPARSSP